MQDSPLIFDRKRLRKQRDRAAGQLQAHDFLFREAADRLADRLEDTTRAFPFALDLGSHSGQLCAILNGRGGIQTLVETDISCAMLAQNPSPLRIAVDEEFLPFTDGAFDLAMSVLSLHWVNDLPGTLVQLRRALKPDGLLLAMLFGGQTLKELRVALELATLEIEGGLSAQVSPFVDVRDAGSLLQRAGFALPVVDAEIVTVSYDNLFALMHELRGMGETNTLLHARKSFARRETFLRAAEIYRDKFSDAEGRIIATFELVTLTAWTPHPDQQKAAKRGSGKVNLNDVFMPESRSAPKTH